MKLSRISVAVFGAALLFSASAFAKNTENKGTLNLDDNVTVAGTSLSPGHYKVEWKGSGPDVTVSLLKGNQTVATFPAKLTEQKAAATADAYGAINQPNGAKTLNSIYFGGKHYVLQIPANGTAQQNTQDSASPAK